MPTILDSVPESHRDLLTTPLTAALTTVDANGRLQSTATWFHVDFDGQLKSATFAHRQKCKNLIANANCVLLIIDPTNPARTLEVRAEAEVVADPQTEVVKRIAGSYGVDAETVDARGGDRYVITYHPWHIVARSARS